DPNSRSRRVLALVTQHRLFRASLTLAIVLASAGIGCVYPATKPLAQAPPNVGAIDLADPGPPPGTAPQYYFKEIPLGAKNTNDVFVALVFSGGGTRAAALSYGVLDKLRNIRINCADPSAPSTCEKSLLDEVDVISSVSGGSFPAAYYALYGDRIFDPKQSFHTGFLKYNVERELFGESLYYPQNWLRLLSRVEIAAN